MTYYPRFVTETDVPPPYNDCNACAMAMEIDHWTYGRIRLTHQAIRAKTGVPVNKGLNYPQIAAAVKALSGLVIQYSDANNPSTNVMSLAQLKSHLATGGGANVCGMYPSLAGLKTSAGLAVNRWQPGYLGGHSMFYSDLRADGTVFQSDPLGRGAYDGERVPLRVLEAFALSPGFGTTSKVTAAFSVVGARPSEPVVPDTAIASGENEMVFVEIEKYPAPRRITVKAGPDVPGYVPPSHTPVRTVAFPRESGFSASGEAWVTGWSTDPKNLVYEYWVAADGTFGPDNNGGQALLVPKRPDQLIPEPKPVASGPTAAEVAALVKQGRQAGARDTAKVATDYAEKQ